MPRKRVEVKGDPFEFVKTNEIDLPRFSTGAVAEILEIENWRLQKFLEHPHYQLSASGQLGEGKGSRRWFTTEDVYRIAIARFLANDGFAPKLIAMILQRLHDRDLIDFDEQGEVRIGITLSRTGKGPRLGFFRSGNPPNVEPAGETYYVLDLGEVTRAIDRRIQVVSRKKGGN